jgi:flagellar basal body-associated protein FliL
MRRLHDKQEHRQKRGEVTMLTILLIVIVVLLLTGGFGYRRRGRSL